MIFTAFFKALMQMTDPRLRRVMLRGVGWAIVALAVLTILTVLSISTVFAGPVTLPLIGDINWLGSALGWGALFLMVPLSVFLMIPVASLLSSFFLEDVADAVEDRHYPALPNAQEQTLVAQIRDTVSQFGVLIGANFLAFAIYAALPFATLLIFWALNGFLLGREYFQLVALRRIPADKATALRKSRWITIWGAGILMTVPLSIPFLNLIIPVLGVATFTHLFQSLTRVGPSG